MHARDLSIYLLTTGVILRRRTRHKAAACRVHGYRVRLSLSLSPFHLRTTFSLALLPGAGLTGLYGQSHGIVDWLDPMIDGALA